MEKEEQEQDESELEEKLDESELEEDEEIDNEELQREIEEIKRKIDQNRFIEFMRTSQVHAEPIIQTTKDIHRINLEQDLAEVVIETPENKKKYDETFLKGYEESTISQYESTEESKYDAVPKKDDRKQKPQMTTEERKLTHEREEQTYTINPQGNR